MKRPCDYCNDSNRKVVIIIAVAGEDTTTCQAPFQTHSTISPSALFHSGESSAQRKVPCRSPQLVRNGSGMWTQAGSPASESVRSPLPCCIYHDCHILILGIRLRASLLSPPPLSHEVKVPASAQKLAPEASAQSG